METCGGNVCAADGGCLSETCGAHLGGHHGGHEPQGCPVFDDLSPQSGSGLNGPCAAFIGSFDGGSSFAAGGYDGGGYDAGGYDDGGYDGGDDGGGDD